MLAVLLFACLAPQEPERCPGAPESESFDVQVHWVQASPLDPSINWWTGEAYETWDWDGDVPNDWVQASSDLAEVLGIIAEVFPSQETIALAEMAAVTEEVLVATDTYAPYLMDRFVEPELHVWAWHVWSEDEIAEHGTTGRLDWNSLEVWPEDLWVPADYSGEDDRMVLTVYDGDAIGEDWVGGLALYRDEARKHAGCGPFVKEGGDGLYAVGLEVEALD